MFQAAGVLVAVVAVLVEWPVVLGAGGVLVLALAQLGWMRRPVPPAKQLGLLQLGCGLGLVALIGDRSARVDVAVLSLGGPR